MTDPALAKRIYDVSHLTGSFTLRSGTVSDQYFDKYLFESDPELLSQVGAGLLRLVPAGTEAVAGPELGGIPLATMVSQLSGLPALFIRKRAKTYGTERLAEGGEVAGRKLTVIEDVVSTGGQLLESCAELAARGAEILAVLAVIDRQTGGAENLAEAGYAFSSLFTMADLEAAVA
jgi:orotate phosphoribosyltransferase